MLPSNGGLMLNNTGPLSRNADGVITQWQSRRYNIRQRIIQQ